MRRFHRNTSCGTSIGKKKQKRRLILLRIVVRARRASRYWKNEKGGKLGSGPSVYPESRERSPKKELKKVGKINRADKQCGTRSGQIKSHLGEKNWERKTLAQCRPPWPRAAWGRRTRKREEKGNAFKICRFHAKKSRGKEMRLTGKMHPTYRL